MGAGRPLDQTPRTGTDLAPSPDWLVPRYAGLRHASKSRKADVYAWFRCRGWQDRPLHLLKTQNSDRRVQAALEWCRGPLRLQGYSQCHLRRSFHVAVFITFPDTGPRRICNIPCQSRRMTRRQRSCVTWYALGAIPSAVKVDSPAAVPRHGGPAPVMPGAAGRQIHPPCPSLAMIRRYVGDPASRRPSASVCKARHTAIFRRQETAGVAIFR
jgi:hypothetical protein